MKLISSFVLNTITNICYIIFVLVSCEENYYFDFRERSTLTFWLDFSSESNVKAKDISDTIKNAAQSSHNNTLLGRIDVDSIFSDLIKSKKL